MTYLVNLLAKKLEVTFSPESAEKNIVKGDSCIKLLCGKKQKTIDYCDNSSVKVYNEKHAACLPHSCNKNQTTTFLGGRVSRAAQPEPRLINTHFPHNARRVAGLPRPNANKTGHVMNQLGFYIALFRTLGNYIRFKRYCSFFFFINYLLTNKTPCTDLMCQGKLDCLTHLLPNKRKIRSQFRNVFS